MSLTKKIKTVLRPFKNAVRNSRIYRAYGQEIDRNLICVISRNGAELAGNMLRLLLSIRSIYGRQYRITVAAEEKAKEKIQSTLAYYELGDVEILRYGSVRHLKELERAGYLLTDTSLPRAFVKREGQVILNTWHGTPLKLMGNHSRSDRLRMDNVQRCLFMTDYLLFPNEYCFEVMTSSYAMQGLYAGSVLTEGYPRNAVFFDSDLREATRDKFKLEDKRVFAYLPTFRDHLQGARVQEQIAQMKEILDYLDANLAEEEILFVKLHYLVSSAIELGGYRHIRPFPEGIETYEFLNAVDCLITDYSSVFYDFANTRRKIIRFVFDEEEYEAARGMYEQPVPAPFPKVYSKDALLSEMRAGKDYDDAAFLSSFCGYDRSDAAERLVRHVFGKENVCESRSIQNTDGKNVLIYVGSLALNGITTSMMNLMQNTKDDGRHYAFAYVRKHLSEHPEYLDQLPQDRTIEIGNERQYTLKEALAIALFYKLGSKRKWVARNVDRYYQREYARFFTGMRADTVIQYTGYTKFITGLLEKAEGKTVIYAHNDMKKELSSKATLNRTALTEAYQNYDRVAACSDSAFQSVKEIGGRTDNLFLCENMFDYKGIRERADEAIEMQEDTELFCEDPDGVTHFIEAHETVFITIGRFSPEKGHDRLLAAFEQLRREAEGIGLIIIGGYGDLYQETLNTVRASEFHKDICVIRSIRNPMPILKRCDCFVLPSRYEGLGLVLLEADCLGVPSFATDIQGPRAIMSHYNGCLVEDSEEGILGGMRDYLNGKIRCMDMDYEEYNRKCIGQYEEMMA